MTVVTKLLFITLNCPVKRPCQRSLYVLIHEAAWHLTSHSSFFFFFFFCLSRPDDEEPWRNVVPSSNWCERAVCLALSHLCGSFTLGLHTGTKGQHCFTLCFLLMATCCFPKAPIIIYKWWCFCKISWDQRHVSDLLFDWCHVHGIIDLTKFFPHALNKSVQSGPIKIRTLTPIN